MLSNLEIIGWKKFWGQPKLDEAVGPVQFGSPRNFLNPIISKLDKHVVLLPINYIGSKKRWTRQIFFYPLKYSISHFALLSTSQVKHFNTGFLLLWVFLFWLFSLISSKSVASISGNLAEDSIWKFRRQKGEEKSREIPPLTQENLASYNRLVTFDGSDNSCNLIGQYSVLGPMSSSFFFAKSYQQNV